MSRTAASSSTSPRASNGVTIAVRMAPSWAGIAAIIAGAPGATSVRRPPAAASGKRTRRPNRVSVVWSARGGASDLNGVAGVRARAAERRTVVRVGEVGPTGRVGVDAEVVEQLSATRAVDAALADSALVDG